MLKADESTFQQHKHDPNKITNLMKDEWDQSDLRLTNYAQNCDQRFLMKNPADLSGLGTNFLKFKSFFPPLILELQGTKIDQIWTQGSPQHKKYIPKRGFSQIQIFPFQFWINTRNLGFGDELTKSSNQRC
jgi:hypothetical protein